MQVLEYVFLGVVQQRNKVVTQGIVQVSMAAGALVSPFARSKILSGSKKRSGGWLQLAKTRLLNGDVYRLESQNTPSCFLWTA